MISIARENKIQIFLKPPWCRGLKLLVAQRYSVHQECACIQAQWALCAIFQTADYQQACPIANSVIFIILRQITAIKANHSILHFLLQNLDLLNHRG